VSLISAHHGSVHEKEALLRRLAAAATGHDVVYRTAKDDAITRRLAAFKALRDRKRSLKALLQDVALR
jgi:hypothetical protein